MSEELSMLAASEVQVSVETLDDRLRAVVTVGDHNRRQVEVRQVDGAWSAYQAIEFDDGGWGPSLRIPRVHRYAVPRTAADLVAYCRWLYEPMTHVA